MVRMLLQKRVKLQEWKQNQRGQMYTQYRITVPTDIVRQCGWERGQELSIMCDSDEHTVKEFTVSEVMERG